MTHHPSEPRRREFLGHLAAGGAVLLAGSSIACAESSADVPAAAAAAGAAQEGEEWLTKLHGQYRQYFDATHWNDGAGPLYAANWASSMKETFGVGNNDVCAVIGFRHFAIAPAFPDAIWQKYQLGKFFSINDPKTKRPSVRNFAYNATEGDFPLPGIGLSDQIANGAVVVVCNLATTVLSGMAAQAAGLQMSASEAYEEWKAALMPGCYLAPTGVLAVHRAQSAGNCTYCFAG